MKTFKAIIATAVVTLSASISMAISEGQRDVCFNIMSKYASNHSSDVLFRACSSSMMDDGREYAGCMLQLARSGVQIGTNTVAPQQKAVTGAALCSEGTNFELNTCIARQVSASHSQGMDLTAAGQKAAQDCRQLAPSLISNMLTNGESFRQTKSNEQIANEALDDLINNYQGGRGSRQTVPSYPTHVRGQQQAQPQVMDTSGSMDNSVLSDLPSVE